MTPTLPVGSLASSRKLDFSQTPLPRHFDRAWKKYVGAKCPWHNNSSYLGEFGRLMGYSCSRVQGEKSAAIVRRSRTFAGLDWNSWEHWNSFFFPHIEEIGSDLVEIPWLMKISQGLDVLHIPDLSEYSHQRPCLWWPWSSNPGEGNYTTWLTLSGIFQTLSREIISKVKYINKFIQHE